MRDNFIAKFETDKFYIGSFDSYIDLSKDLIKTNSNIADEEADSIIKTMPTTSRAAIVDKNGEYVGYIGLFNVDGQNDIASIRFEVNKDLSEEEKNEILNVFYGYIGDSLNIGDIEENIYISKNTTEVKEKRIVPSNIIIPSKLLVPGVSEEDLERFSQDYSIPKLQFPFTIKYNDRTIGIVGLSSLIWSNKRANLNVFLDKSLGDEIINLISGDIIDEYIIQAHYAKVHNISLSVNGSDNNMLDILKDSRMQYYGRIPYGAANGDSIESNYLFQHIPTMETDSGILIPDNNSILLSSLETEKKELSKVVDLENGYKMVSPSAFEELGIDFDSILNSHIQAMQNRDNFTIPLGEDKYFLQKGNEKYGITKALMNYNYVVLDENGNYAGFINTLRTNANGKNVEVEIAVDPKIQRNGLGTAVINKFYDELFSIGVASVTSTVFSFNKPSNKLHEKVAELQGVRLEGYYINGQLYDMNIYTRTNDTIEGIHR